MTKAKRSQVAEKDTGAFASGITAVISLPGLDMR